MIAFITFKSSLVPLLEGLWSSNSWEFEVSGFRRNPTDDLGIDSPSLWPTEPRLHVRQYSTYFAISWLGSAPRNLPCVPLAVLYASILSLVISSSAAIVPLLCWKSVKCQHPWQKATSSRLLCSAVSCGILAQVLLALPQFVIVGSGRRSRAPTQPSGETHLKHNKPKIKNLAEWIQN